MVELIVSFTIMGLLTTMAVPLAAYKVKRDKERERFNHAPCVIAVIATLTPDHKIPESEQIQSGSCVCFALLQAADALGFGAQWRGRRRPGCGRT